MSKEIKCKTCGGHGGAIRCPKCDAQICWIDIDPKKEGFIRCRRCKTSETEFVKVPCPDCQQPPAGEFTKAIRSKLLDVALYCGGVDSTAEPFQDLRDLCDRLDRAEAENIELKAADKTHLSAFNGLQERYLQLEDINADLLEACEYAVTAIGIGWNMRKVLNAAISKAKQVGK